MGRPFSAFDLAETIRLREVERLGWKRIGKTLGRNKDVCRQHYSLARGKAAVHFAATGREALEWTAETDAELRSLRDVEGFSYAKIAMRLGRSESACRARYANLQCLQGPGAAETHAPPPARAPERVGLTAIVFGDPPPGRSALDRARAGRAQASTPWRDGEQLEGESTPACEPVGADA